MESAKTVKEYKTDEGYFVGQLTDTKPSCKRGKSAKSDAHNPWEWLKEHEASVLLFAKDSYMFHLLIIELNKI